MDQNQLTTINKLQNMESKLQPKLLYSPINFNQYYDLSVYALIVPFQENDIFVGRKILHQIGMDIHDYCEVINIKTFYGSKITDFIGLATIGKTGGELKTVLAAQYFKGHQYQLTMVENQLWAMIYVKSGWVE